MISVIVPCLGPTVLDARLWHKNFSNLYAGPIEFIFVVESEDAPSAPAITALQRAHPSVAVRLVIAGSAWHCSQKIHEVLEGMAHAAPRADLLLVLEPTAHPHAGSIVAMAFSLQQSPNVFVATGPARAT